MQATSWNHAPYLFRNEVAGKKQWRNSSSHHRTPWQRRRMQDGSCRLWRLKARQRSNRNGLIRCPSLRAKASSAKAPFACQTRLESLIKRSSNCGNLTDRGFNWLAGRRHNRRSRTPTVTIALPGSAIFKYAKSCGAFNFRAEASCRSPSRTFALVCDNCGSTRDFPFRRFFP